MCTSYALDLKSMLRDYFEKVLKEVSVDCVIFGFTEGRLKVLLLRWKMTDKWSLPGGRIFKDEPADIAVERVLEERTGLRKVFLQQFHTFGDTGRYKYYSEKETLKVAERASGEKLSDLKIVPRTVSIGYYALVNIDRVRAKPDAYSDECQWFEISEVPKLLFDHNEMIEIAMRVLKKEVRFQPIGNLLPERFTLSELHKLFEAILNTKLDRRNFHKLVTSYDFLIKLPEKRTGSANKSPHLYRFDFRKYHAALKSGI